MGGFSTTVCQFTGSMGVLVCVWTTEGKEHWGQLYLRCLVVVSWQCPSHHSIGWMLDLTELTLMPHHSHKIHMPTHKHAPKPDRQICTCWVTSWYMKTQRWFRQNVVAHIRKTPIDTHTHTCVCLTAINRDSRIALATYHRYTKIECRSAWIKGRVGTLLFSLSRNDFADNWWLILKDFVWG